MNSHYPSWDLLCLLRADVVAQSSKDPSTKVGAVLVTALPHVIRTGFNQFPPGHDEAKYHDRPYKYQHIKHAEVVALEALGPVSPSGATLYTSYPVCPTCMEALGKAGVARVLYFTASMEGRETAGMEDWNARAREALDVAARYGIEVEAVERPRRV